jgi:hypothetical protein
MRFETVRVTPDISPMPTREIGEMGSDCSRLDACGQEYDRKTASFSTTRDFGSGVRNLVV